MKPGSEIQRLFMHCVLQAGFRPLFILGFASAVVLPVVWYLIYSNKLVFNSHVSSLQWHVHEMFFGFAWAVLGGFLLTASKNWAGVRGFHGASLFALVVLWLFDRVAFWLPGDTPFWITLLLHNAFLLMIVPMILWTWLSNLQKIAPDNWYFILGLPIFFVSKNLMLTDQYFELGWTLTLGVFRLAVVIMLERTLVAFMKITFQLSVITCFSMIILY